MLISNLLMTSMLTLNLCLTKMDGSMDLGMDSGTVANIYAFMICYQGQQFYLSQNIEDISESLKLQCREE